MKRARFLTLARRELLAHTAYYDLQDAGLGSRFAGAVEVAVSRALAFPLSGSPAYKNTRRVFVRDFPFSVIYRPDEQGILVFALAHHARSPEHWQLRVQEP